MRVAPVTNNGINQRFPNFFRWRHPFKTYQESRRPFKTYERRRNWQIPSFMKQLCLHHVYCKK